LVAGQMLQLNRFFGYTIVGVLLLFLGVMSYGIIQSGTIRVEQISVSCHLPPEDNGLAILQVSDLHSTAGFVLERQAAELLAGMQANVMILTGDFRKPGTAPDVSIEGGRIVADSVRKRMPVYSVQGNNDRPATMRGIANSGITVLNNKAVRIGKATWLVGWNPYGSKSPKLHVILQDIPAGQPFILAAHSPDVIKEKGSERALLILTGHTHGGQIRLPGLDPFFLYTHISFDYYAGLYKVGGQYLYINRGIGTTMIPLRAFSPPEISRLVLHSLTSSRP
jgi:uncharacterized protein